MKTNKRHREALVDELIDVIEKKELVTSVLGQNDPSHDKGLIAMWEVELFLLDKQIEVIQTALIKNDLENF